MSATAADPHRVLVVDDEPNIVDVISMALRFQGFAVESAGTGSQAIAAVNDFRPHLIVLDVMLPDMEGFDVANRLGAQRSRAPTPPPPPGGAARAGARARRRGGGPHPPPPPSRRGCLVGRIRTILRRA